MERRGWARFPLVWKKNEEVYIHKTIDDFRVDIFVVLTADGLHLQREGTGPSQPPPQPAAPP
eukprot:3790576-Amphidinium_carterae.1